MSSPQSVLQEALLLQRSGRVAEAVVRYAQYTQLKPNDAGGWQSLAIVAQQAGDLMRAGKAVAKALDLRPNDTQCLLLAGNIRQDLGDLEGAVKHLEKAVRLDPGFAQAHNNLGIIQRSRGMKEKAAACFRAAVKAKPDYMRAWNNLGSTLLHMESAEEAVACFGKALALDPNYAYAHLNLGLYQLAVGKFADAEASLRRATELEPRMADAHLGLGRLFRELMDLDRAEQALRQSVSLNPRGIDALLGLAEVFAEKGQRGAALDCYRRAAGVQPANLRARMGLALTLPQVYADAAEIDAARAEYTAGLAALQAEATSLAAALNPEERTGTVQWNNFYLAYQGRDDRELQAQFARFQRAILEPALPQFYQPIATRARGGRRLRVGFVSQFFYHCTAGNYFKSWVTRLDRDRFETVVYSLNNRPDAVTREIEQAAGRFRQQSFSFAGLAQSLRAEELDVLIYPELGMNPRVFTLASLRLAPLQCAGWGHPVTTGHANLDVFFSSEAMEPAAGEAHYTERLVKLPGIGTCYPRPLVPEPVTRTALGLPEEAILYLFPQSLFKVHPDNDRLLVEIVSREPRAVVVMFQSRFDSITRLFVDRLSRQFAQRGIATAGRVKLLPNMSHADYLRVNLACDVMLDSLYWSGGNTSLDATACRLPMVTKPGELMRGRQSAGMLSLMGLDELVVTTEEAYVDCALRLGHEASYRTAIRSAIAERSHRLFDEEAPVQALESFLLSAVPE
jgi:predicted O-linked N-acetylglucosamine transferase (SPINDLY family)